MSSLRVSIDIDKLGAAIKQDPNLIEKVTFKDGTEHRMIKVNIMERKQPSEHGATHYMKFDMYHKTELNGVNYYLGDCYPINFGKGSGTQQQAQPGQLSTPPQEQQPTQQPAASDGASDDLPF